MEKYDIQKEKVGFVIDRISLEIIDEAAKKDNRTRSGFLIHASLKYASYVNNKNEQ
jgi:uncharacterized protein (DUF1778 family)